jgi:hypothetical protein
MMRKTLTMRKSSFIYWIVLSALLSKENPAAFCFLTVILDLRKQEMEQALGTEK